MENGGAPQQGEGKDPSGFLGDIINSAVTVKLNSGVVYKGMCAALYLPSRPYICSLPPGSLSLSPVPPVATSTTVVVPQSQLP